MPPSSAPAPKGVTRVPIDFGAFPETIQFEGDRIYIARWSCSYSNEPGVTLEVLDRKTFRAIKRVVIAGCDDMQQDSITALGFVPGYIVLGLAYRSRRRAGRRSPSSTGERSRSSRRASSHRRLLGLSQWKGRLLACASGADQTQSPASDAC